ncbi:hypothetical protein HanIR_Chr01g0001201 [Helianthus annuus]|nr:hypothetical protein HanIR_Chr01g0001201 [Helianthus annuus]
MYSASHVDRETTTCFFHCQETRRFPRSCAPLEVDFLFSRHPPKSASAYAIKSRPPSTGYHNPSLGVPFRYLKIRLTAFK